MFDGRTKLASQVVQEVRDHFGSKVCNQIIPGLCVYPRPLLMGNRSSTLILKAVQH